jgi:hypothetical protein
LQPNVDAAIRVCFSAAAKIASRVEREQLHKSKSSGAESALVIASRLRRVIDMKPGDTL